MGDKPFSFFDCPKAQTCVLGIFAQNPAEIGRTLVRQKRPVCNRPFTKEELEEMENFKRQFPEAFINIEPI
jgi:hypothetical protein